MVSKNELEQIVKQTLENESTRKDCICGNPYDPLIIESYPHNGGIFIDESGKKEWAYLHCSYCQHDTSLWKLGGEIPKLYNQKPEQDRGVA